MNREYHSWYSPHLDRDMELLVFGHAGAKVLVFPTRTARFHEYENLRIVDALRPKLEAGEMQLFCVDSIDQESFYAFPALPENRIRRHMDYERYIVDEVIPFMNAKNDNAFTISHGCSMGAYHAANIAFRHPHLFQKLAAFSGRYDPTLEVEFFRDLLDGHRDENVFAHTPVAYLPHVDGEQLEALRRMEIVLVIGREDPFLENNHLVSDILSRKDVRHTLVEWDERAHKGYYWRRMAPQYLCRCYVPAGTTSADLRAMKAYLGADEHHEHHEHRERHEHHEHRERHDVVDDDVAGERHLVPERQAA